MPYHWPWQATDSEVQSNEEPDPLNRLPSKIDGYILTRVLGSGHYGVVLFAIQETTGKEFAVKASYRDSMESIDYRQIWQNLACFRHSHIIRQYKIIICPMCIYDVMEYWSEKSLSRYTPETVNEARKIFQQILSAVDYCHRQGLVHRDIKPGNILIDEHCLVKLVDFGLSAMRSDGKYLSLFCGSRFYWAPEIGACRPYVGPEVDVYSAGATLYTLAVRATANEWGLGFQLGEAVSEVPIHPDISDLINFMKERNPVKRATIDDVKKNHWFRHELPEYLFPTKRNERFDWINIKILEEVSKKLQVPIKDVHTNILTNRWRNSEIFLRYCLTKDNWYCDKLLAECPVFWEFRIGPPKRKTTPEDQKENTKGKKKKRKEKKASEARHRKSKEKGSPKKKPEPAAAATPETEEEDKQMVFDRGLKLHVGYTLKVVVDALYNVLISLNLEWKFLRGYKWLVRRKGGSKTSPKMIFNIYRTGTKTYPHVICLRSLSYADTTGTRPVTETHHNVMEFLEEGSLLYCQLYLNMDVNPGTEERGSLLDFACCFF